MATPTKADLISQANQMGLEADDSMTKDEIQALIDGASGGAAPAEGASDTEIIDPANAVCCRCGAPATYESASEAVNTVYYCDTHGPTSGEPVKSIGS